MKKISFTIKLNVDISNFTNQIYESVLSEMVNFTNKSSSEIYIISIKNGSSIVTGGIKVTDPPDSDRTLALLKNLAGSNITLGDQ